MGLIFKPVLINHETFPLPYPRKAILLSGPHKEGLYQHKLTHHGLSVCTRRMDHGPMIQIVEMIGSTLMAHANIY